MSESKSGNEKTGDTGTVSWHEIGDERPTNQGKSNQIKVGTKRTRGTSDQSASVSRSENGRIGAGRSVRCEVPGVR